MKGYRHILLSNDSGRRIELQNAPIGWDAQKINIVRDFTYFGVLKTLSVEFELVGDGYRFIQNEYLTFGADADIIYRIYKYDYEFVFEGKVDLQNFSDDRTNRKFRIDIIQSDLVQKFNNSDTIKLNLLNNISLDRTPIQPVVPQPALFRGHIIEQHSEFEGSIIDTGEIYHHIIPFQILSNDNEDVQAISNIEISTAVEELYKVDNHFYINRLNANQTVRINMSFTASITRETVFFGFSIVVKHKILLINENDTVASVLFEKSTAMDITSPETIQVSGTYSNNSLIVQPGQHLVAVCERYLADGVTPLSGEQMEGTRKASILYSDLSMTIDIDSVAADSTHPVILPHELFSNLAAQIFGKDDSFYSEYFGRTELGYDVDGEGAYLAITQGDLLRGVPLTETQIITTFKDAYKSYDSIANLAVKIEANRIVIEPKDKMFSGEIVADLGEVSNLKVNPAKDFLFNSVIAGYPPIDYEAVNGRTEFNTEVQYTNSFRSVKKELDIRSVYRGDARGIEEARRLSISTTGTKDSKYDNKIFLIDLINDNGTLKTRRTEGIIHVDGIFSADTAYNLRIFPGQNLLRWQRYLSIPLHRKDKVYFFQAKEKNSGATVVTALGESIDGEDLILEGAPYFLPEEKTFERSITLETLSGILSNPLGLIKYTHKGESFFDYLLEVDSETENKRTTYRVLSSRPSPMKISEGVEQGNFIKYDNGSDSFIEYQPDGLILYQ
ncbi:MAG: hypothetical protein DIU61_008790 [Bacteroidota bacterium]